ncbi:MAG: hypothetical protein AB7O97_13840 [Planctomycetota bacterium]
MRDGSDEIGRRASAKVTGIAFAITYLWAQLSGAGGLTALTRAAVVAVIALGLSYVLLRPVIDAVLDALARDEAKRQAELAKEDDA